MNKHQINGQARRLKGILMERLGRFIGDDSMEHNGAAECSAGRIEKAYGDTKRNMKRMLRRRASGDGATG